MEHKTLLCRYFLTFVCCFDHFLAYHVSTVGLATSISIAYDCTVAIDIFHRVRDEAKYGSVHKLPPLPVVRMTPF